jgi:DNA-directed RNA polymerase specialized sigma24 family protein
VAELFARYRAGEREEVRRRHDAFIATLIEGFEGGREAAVRELHGAYVAELCALVRACDADGLRHFHDLFVGQVTARGLPEEKPLCRFLDSLYVEQLAARYQAGDREAATQLDRRFRHEMLHLARLELARRNRGSEVSSEGVVQEALRSFFSAIRAPDFDLKKGAIGGYLVTIVRRKVSGRFRRKSPRPVALEPTRVAAMADAAPASEGGTLSHPEAITHLRELLDSVLDRYTRKGQQIIEYHVDEYTDRSPWEIARLCRCTETYVNKVIAGFTSELQRLARSDDVPCREDE